MAKKKGDEYQPVRYQMTHVPLKRTADTWPQKLFFYRPGEMTPCFTFERKSLTSNWKGHGFHAMSKEKVAQWVDEQPYPATTT